MQTTERTDPTATTHHNAVLDAQENRALALYRALVYEQEVRAAAQTLTTRLGTIRRALISLEQVDVPGPALAELRLLETSLVAATKRADEEALTAAQTTNELADALPTDAAELLILLGQRLGTAR